VPREIEQGAVRAIYEETLMPDTFRLKVAARRQVTLPPRALELLRLDEGDVLEISIEGSSFTGRGLKLVPTNLFTPELLDQLHKREREIEEGGGIEARNKEELVSKLRKRSVPAGSHV
jgi:bifunctional DNA-binding transcriptional regulator/antitoxin component of YhaV-PrlF toxin-antitoxin module